MAPARRRIAEHLSGLVAGNFRLLDGVVHHIVLMATSILSQNPRCFRSMPQGVLFCRAHLAFGSLAFWLPRHGTGERLPWTATARSPTTPIRYN